MKFNIDSPLFQFLTTLADFILLNILFILTCIPIVTIGPALNALYTITLREAREEHGYITKPYFKAFKENFKNSFLLFLIYFLAGAVLLYNVVFWLQVRNKISTVILLVIALCCVLYLLSLLYVFPLAARFENSVKQTIKNSLLLALSNPGQTAILVLILLCIVVLLYFTAIFRVFLIIFGFATIAYVESYLFTKVFQKYENE